MCAESSLLGWGYHPPKRLYLGLPEYIGDYFGTKPVQVERWTPNRIILIGTPGDTVTLNINPSNHWVMNGERLFPSYRAMEIELPFTVTVPPGGRMEFVARPPYWKALLLMQALFGLAGLVLFVRLARRRGAAEAIPPQRPLQTAGESLSPASDAIRI
jgi:hypothetical protein